MLTVGQNLYLERIRRRLSQAELSRRTGIAQPNLSNIEKGKQDITVSTLFEICLALGVKPSRVLDATAGRRPRTRFTRARLEKIAAAVVGKLPPASREDREIARLLRSNMALGGSRRTSFKNAGIHWANLRRRLSDKEIETLQQRVEDFLQRSSHAKNRY